MGKLWKEGIVGLEGDKERQKETKKQRNKETKKQRKKERRKVIPL